MKKCQKREKIYKRAIRVIYFLLKIRFEKKEKIKKYIVVFNGLRLKIVL